MQVFAAYAACVAMNNVLPANLGTIVMFVMLTTVIVSATFAGMLGGFLVQKIFFMLAGAFVYLYLFLSVPGSFDIDFAWIKEHPGRRRDPGRRRAAVVLVLDRAELLAEGPRVVGAGEGGRPDPAHPGAYFGRVFLPEFVAWVASL